MTAGGNVSSTNVNVAGSVCENVVVILTGPSFRKVSVAVTRAPGSGTVGVIVQQLCPSGESRPSPRATASVRCARGSVSKGKA